MKKLIILLFLTFPLNLLAQDIKTLIHQADSLKALSKHKKALKLYDKAITRIASYQDTVSQSEWFRICTAAADLVGNDYMKYSPAKYFVGGQKFNDKITDLKKQGSNCILTYNTYTSGIGISYVIDPKKKFQFIPSTNRLLIWVIKDDLYIQGFGNNIFKPLKIDDPALVTFLQTNYNKLPSEEIGRQRFNLVDGITVCVFNFYVGDKVYKKEIDAQPSASNSQQNENTYLGKLLTLIQAEVKNYYARLNLNNIHF